MVNNCSSLMFFVMIFFISMLLCNCMSGNKEHYTNNENEFITDIYNSCYKDFKKSGKYKTYTDWLKNENGNGMGACRIGYDKYMTLKKFVSHEEKKKNNYR